MISVLVANKNHFPINIHFVDKEGSEPHDHPLTAGRSTLVMVEDSGLIELTAPRNHYTGLPEDKFKVDLLSAVNGRSLQVEYGGEELLRDLLDPIVEMTVEIPGEHRILITSHMPEE